MAAPAKPLTRDHEIITPCRGTGVVFAHETTDGCDYFDCPGCADCDRDAVAARTPAMSTERAFALLPAIDDEEW